MKVAFVLISTEDCSEMKIKIFQINQTQYFFVCILCRLLFNERSFQNVLFSFGAGAVFMLVALDMVVRIYAVYARTIDANKNLIIAHIVASAYLISIVVGKPELMSGVAGIYFFWFCFYEESLVSVIKYMNEERAVRKIKKCKVFSKNEPVDFLIKIAESENKQKVLDVLRERKNESLS